VRTALVGVVGDDDAGESVLAQARNDGLRLSGVTCREGTRTGLIVDIVDAAGRWRYLEDLPQAVLLSEGGGFQGVLGWSRGETGRPARWATTSSGLCPA
jgi:pfkB family carbohydrate kinase